MVLLWGDFSGEINPYPDCYGWDNVSPHVREYSRRRGFQILRTEFQSLPVELGIWITIDNAVLYSSSCIPDSKVQDSPFHRQKFSAFISTWGEMLRKGFIVSRSSIINRSLGGLNKVNSMFLDFSSEIYQETDLNTYQQNFFQTKASWQTCK